MAVFSRKDKPAVASSAEMLQHHWAMDAQAAEVLAERLEAFGQAEQLETAVQHLSDEAVAKRDANRQAITDIVSGESDKNLIVLGPCSIDAQTDYAKLFDSLQETQELHPNSLVGIRLNFAKPRTKGGWTGLWYSLDPAERQTIFDLHQRTLELGYPIIDEVTQTPQVGALAPYLSGMWLGARDMQSTTLRSMASAIHLPTGVKNSNDDGSPEKIACTIAAVKSNTETNEGSGVDLGTIAGTSEFPGVPTGILPVGEGNEDTFIIARGYDLKQNQLSDEMRRHLVVKHLGAICTLAAKLDKKVLIDGSHDVPPMFNIDRSEPDRLPVVIGKISSAIMGREVENAQQLSGLLAEVGPTHGKTDPNFLLDSERLVKLHGAIGNLLQSLTSVKKTNSSLLMV